MMFRAWFLLVACVAACGTTSTPPAPASPPPAPPSTASRGTTVAPAATPYQGHGADSISPETVARFAAPPLPPAQSARIQALLDVRGAERGLLTSNGGRMVFSWRVTGVEQVWRQDGPGRFPVQLTGGSDATWAVDIMPDDRTLIVQRDRGGEENPGLYLLDIEGGPLRLIQHTPKVQTFHQLVSDDGTHVYFVANDVDPASFVLYRYDITTGQREVVFDEPGLWRVADHRGQRLLLTKALGNAHDEVHELDTSTGKRVLLLGEGESEAYQVRYGARDGTLLVRTNKGSEFERIFEWKAGRLVAVSPDMKHDIESFDVDRARRRIVYQVNEDGYKRTRALDARTYKPVTLTIPPADLIEPEWTSRDGRFLVVSRESATLPVTPAVWDWKTGKSTTWQQPSTPELDTSAFAVNTLESYPARDGTPIPMFVRRPAKCATEACPVVVDFHGGPESQALPGFSTTGQLLVEAGFVHVRPNVRGSSGYGKAWLHSDDGPRRLTVVTDIEDCARHIRSAWAKNGQTPRIAVIGGSYGGYSVLMAMTYFAGAYDVGVSIVGISDLHTFLANTAPYRRILRISEYGDPEKDREALLELSPMTHIDKIKAPLLLIQGVNDPRVPVGEALTIRQALADRGIDNGLILFPDEGHGAKKRANIVLQVGHMLAFLQKHLQAP